MAVNRRLYYQILFWFVSALAVAFFAARVYLPWTHTLENNGHWDSTKVGLARGVMGGVAYEITPLGLVGDELNLGAWHGFQEVWLKRVWNPESVRFEMRLKPQAYLYFLFDKNPEGFKGLRLSRHPDFPSMFFQADSRGAFLQRHFLPQLQIDGKNQKLEVGFTPEGVLLKGTPGEAGPWRVPLHFPQKLGFRGGSGGAWLDHLEIQNKAGSIFYENFSNHTSLWTAVLWALLGVLTINLVVFLFRRQFHSIMTFNLMLFFILVPLDLTNRLFLVRNYQAAKLMFKAVTRWGDYQSNIETRSEALRRLRMEYPLQAKALGKRILFVGTSQTWGAGAGDPDQTFVSRLERDLQADPQLGPELQIINTGISGEKAGSLLEAYRNEWSQWRPNLLILNLSNNDQDSETFRHNMKEWLETAKQEKIPVLLVLEPNSPEQVRANLFPNHEIMRQLSREYGTRLFDLHACLASQAEAGLLWWDFVHMTSLGQKLAKDCLLKPIKNSLGSF